MFPWTWFWFWRGASAVAVGTAVAVGPPAEKPCVMSKGLADAIGYGTWLHEIQSITNCTGERRQRTDGPGQELVFVGPKPGSEVKLRLIGSQVHEIIKVGME